MAFWSSFFPSYARRSRAIGLGFALALTGAAIAAPGGCTFSTDGIPGSTGGASTSSTSTGGCASDAECDDKNACTVDACMAGVCKNTVDDTLTPPDEHPCTDDACEGGVEKHPAKAKGTLCNPGSTLTCDGMGNCPPCSVDADCGAPMFDGCTVPTCASSICTNKKKMTGEMAATQAPNDCKVNVCGADGMPTSMPDVTDKPIDNLNPCTDKLCSTDGTPSMPFTAKDTPCPGGVCDGAGTCAGCAVDADCMAMGAGFSCDLPTHTCVSCTDNAMNGTETGVDCGGSCKACKGAACSVKSDCAGDHCADGVCCDTDCTAACVACNLMGSEGTCASLPIGQPDPTFCGNPLTKSCDGAGMCKASAGNGCSMDSACATNVCFAGVCVVQTGGACGDDIECGSGLCMSNKCVDCSVGGECKSMACNAPTCKAPGGAPCEVDGDCAGNKCQLKLCLLDNSAACNANADCKSGACKMGLCQPCANAADCGGNATCGNTPFGMNTCERPTGAYCINTPQCAGGGAAKCSGFPQKCQ